MKTHNINCAKNKDKIVIFVKKKYCRCECMRKDIDRLRNIVNRIT
jgi:hypothetical protein